MPFCNVSATCEDARQQSPTKQPSGRDLLSGGFPIVLSVVALPSAVDFSHLRATVDNALFLLNKQALLSSSLIIERPMQIASRSSSCRRCHV